MDGCPFCHIATHGLPAHGLYEDESHFMLLDRGSLGKAHCMLIPKRHVQQVYELDETAYLGLFNLARKIAPCLQDAAHARAVGFVIFGSGLPHAHLHLVPHNDPSELETPHPQILSVADLQANAAWLRPFVTECLSR